MKNWKILIVFAISAGLLVCQTSAAEPKDSAQAVIWKEALGGVTLIELPATAARVVSHSSEQERTACTVAVVEIGVGLASTAAPAIVGAISRAVPTMAPISALTAARMQPKQLALITKSAAFSAPSQGGKIVETLIHEFPLKYPAIAIVAAEGAPEAANDILTVIADFVPTLHAPIQKALNAAKGAPNIPVAAILQQSTADVYKGANSSSATKRASGDQELETNAVVSMNPVQLDRDDLFPENYGGRDTARP